jgi:hypothetical protein
MPEQNKDDREVRIPIAMLVGIIHDKYKGPRNRFSADGKKQVQDIG